MLYQTLNDLIKNGCGGVYIVAEEIGISPRAIYNWVNKDALPRTEYTEETNYAHTLALLSGEDAEAIKARFKPLPIDIVETA